MKSATAAKAVTCPALIVGHGAATEKAFRHYFRDEAKNHHTRFAYLQAWGSFSAWAIESGYSLTELDPAKISKYVSHLARVGSPATANLHLAAVRSVCGLLVREGRLRFSPAASVAAAPAMRRRLSPSSVKMSSVSKLLDACPDTLPGLRDRALIALLVYACTESGGALSLTLADYVTDEKGTWIRLKGRAGAVYLLPVHPVLARCVDAYLVAASRSKGDGSKPMFRAMDRRHVELGENGLTRVDALRIVKNACVNARVRRISCRDLRNAGVRAFLRNGGSAHVARHFFGVIVGGPPGKSTGLLDSSEIARIAS